MLYKDLYFLSFMYYVAYTLQVVTSEDCSSCVLVEDCATFQSMSKREKQLWIEKYPCDNTPSSTTSMYFGFSSVAKGDHICCPKNTRTISSFNENLDHIDNTHKKYTALNKHVPNSSSDNSSKIQYREQNISHSYKNVRNEKYLQLSPYTNIYKRMLKREVSERDIIAGQTYNPYFLKKSLYPKQVQQNLNSNNEHKNSDTETNSGQQCAAQTSLPPDPETGCCGRDTSDADRITDLETLYINAPESKNWTRYFLTQMTQREVNKPQKGKKRKMDSTDVTFKYRISGGDETELDQFPWTVLLEILFNYGDKLVSYNCGGSLISSRYILTAAHCVYEEGAQIEGIQITLAEYDKRTFPYDCTIESEKEQKCIQNFIIPAEEIIMHPQYENTWLHNDIALIRLRGFAPYTRFVRPICLARLDIDIPTLKNLPLAVTGWGRNKQYATSVKQFTVLNLIPHDRCEIYYPNLSRNHICAAGRTGEDTCMGDSGGPLMVLFRGSYYVMGVVSGKRADSPCGSTIPSLFTNVFNYLDWIQSVIRN